MIIERDMSDDVIQVVLQSKKTNREVRRNMAIFIGTFLLTAEMLHFARSGGTCLLVQTHLRFFLFIGGEKCLKKQILSS